MLYLSRALGLVSTVKFPINIQSPCYVLRYSGYKSRAIVQPYSYWQSEPGDYFLEQIFTTTEAVSVLVGYASTHPETVSTLTNKYL